MTAGRTRRGPRTLAVLLAAGEGARAGGRKQFREAAGKSVLRHAAEGLLAVREIRGLIVVVPADAIESVRADLAALDRVLAVIAGGATRHLSSRAGVAALPDSTELVLIHDAARPFATPPLIRRVMRAARDVGAAMPAVPVPDSTIELDGEGTLRRYLPRERLRAVQTPQAFRREVLVRAFGATRSTDFPDDASVVRRSGAEVAVVAGEASNRKITTAEELEAALRLLGPPAPVRQLPRSQLRS